MPYWNVHTCAWGDMFKNIVISILFSNKIKIIVPIYTYTHIHICHTHKYTHATHECKLPINVYKWET